MHKLIFFLMTLLALPVTAWAGDLNIYSSRNKSYLEPLLDAYSQESSVAVSFQIADSPALIRLLKMEGERSLADVVLLTGAGNLIKAEKNGLLASVESSTLDDNVPAHLRSANKQWFALSKRARAIIYHPGRVDVAALNNYQGLAEKQWQGRLCLTSAESEYTQSFVALLLQRQGEQATRQMLEGWVANLADKPVANDDTVIAGIQQGICDLGIINAYYYARLQHEDRKTPLKLFWPDQGDSTVSINVTGAGIAAHAPNKAQAIDFLEWLSLKRQQAQYARLSMEYPVNPKVYPPREIGKWGRFEEDKQPLSNVSNNLAKARALLKEAGYQ